MTAPRVRVLVGDLSLTGVPIVLERMVRWAVVQRGAIVDVVAIHGGPLGSELAPVVASLTVLEPAGRRSAAGAMAAGFAALEHPSAGRVVRELAWRARLAPLPAPDVVLMHGAGAWPLVATAPRSVPLVLHLHELQIGMDRSIPATERASLYQRAQRILAVCDEVAVVARADGAPTGRISIVPGVTDPTAEGSEPSRRNPDHLGPVVAGLGAPGWRKATDRFVALAHELSRTHPQARCIWVGGSPTGTLAPIVTSTTPVEWMPSRPDPWVGLANAAVLVVPSREDALPLVALEAAQHHVPVVCAATGGLTNLFADGRGSVVPGHDLHALHAAVSDAINDPDTAASMAAAAALHVAEHFSLEHVGPRWWAAITGVVETHNNSGRQR